MSGDDCVRYAPLQHGERFWSYVDGKWYLVIRDPSVQRGKKSGEYKIDLSVAAAER